MIRIKIIATSMFFILLRFPAAAQADKEAKEESTETNTQQKDASQLAKHYCGTIPPVKFLPYYEMSNGERTWISYNESLNITVSCVEMRQTPFKDWH